MRAAGYSSTLSSQVASFRKNGYVLIRKAPTATPELVASINSEVTNHFNDIESSYKYRFWRFCNSVSTPLKRHSIPLELSSGVRKLLTANVTHVGPFLETQLSTDSPLVSTVSLQYTRTCPHTCMHTTIGLTYHHFRSPCVKGRAQCYHISKRIFGSRYAQ